MNKTKSGKAKKNAPANLELVVKNEVNEKTNLKNKHCKKNGLVNGISNNAKDCKGEKKTPEHHDENEKHESKSEGEERHKLTKLDSNENISDKMLVVEKVDLGIGFTNEDSTASSSNKATSSSDEKISELAEDLNKVEITTNSPKIRYIQYESELQMPMIMKIIQKDLSEPYSIYTYRYFIHNWPKLCFLAMCEDECVGAIVCKLDIHRKVIKRGYIAMLAVDQNYRKLGIGSTLVRLAIQEMIIGDADEVVLETEVTNKPALQLYEALGFVRDKRLFRYYLNGVDALRLKLWLR